ncbi:Putative ATPase [Anopheles sinensis]|uniref:Putative ATPase n=1 Tax=Anopheles sinensis TaxID=74873 RepID=A0A084WN80_ANOSI|nr:Putative ATPase [Anopheles sinensis]
MDTECRSLKRQTAHCCQKNVRRIVCCPNNSRIGIVTETAEVSQQRAIEPVTAAECVYRSPPGGGKPRKAVRCGAVWREQQQQQQPRCLSLASGTCSQSGSIRR